MWQYLLYCRASIRALPNQIVRLIDEKQHHRYHNWKMEPSQIDAKEQQKNETWIERSRRMELLDGIFKWDIWNGPVLIRKYQWTLL